MEALSSAAGTSVKAEFGADFLIVGSGFGGSVSALRLVEKGYRVLVLEAGRRWQTGVLSGAGVGGGSLVYANTLLEPMDSFFRDARWASLDDWKVALAPHYAEAKRMLGATPSRFLGAGDERLLLVCS